MNYTKVSIKRLWHGFASVRDYLVKEAIESGKGLELIYNKDRMWINNTEIQGKVIVNTSNKFKSKHNDREYQLWDFIWKPEVSNQLSWIKK